MRFKSIELIGTGDDCERCQKACLCNLPGQGSPNFPNDKNNSDCVICQEGIDRVVCESCGNEVILF